MDILNRELSVANKIKCPAFVNVQHVRALLMEAIGTFVFVFSIALIVTNGSTLPPAFGIGFTLLFLVYIGGPISGGHFNPALTFSELIAGRRNRLLMFAYWIVQCVGALLAGVSVRLIRGADTIPAPVHFSDEASEIAVEILFTGCLVLTAWKTGLSRAAVRKGNSYYGLAISSVVMSGIFGAGSISGAVFNPAVALGLCSLGVSEWGTLWIYIISQLAGGVIGLILFLLLEDEHADEKAKTSEPSNDIPLVEQPPTREDPVDLED
jgi:aquaporin Z